MTTLREAAQQALEAYDKHYPLAVVMEDLRAALAEEALQRLTNVQQEIEAALERPVAQYSDIVSDGGMDPRNKYDTTTPQRKPLTDEAIFLAYQKQWHFHPAEEPNLAKGVLQFARAIEAAHGIKEGT